MHAVGPSGASHEYRRCCFARCYDLFAPCIRFARFGHRGAYCRIYVGASRLPFVDASCASSLCASALSADRYRVCPRHRNRIHHSCPTKSHLLMDQIRQYERRWLTRPHRLLKQCCQQAGRTGGPKAPGRGVTPWGGSQTLGAARVCGRRRATRKLHLV